MFESMYRSISFMHRHDIVFSAQMCLVFINHWKENHIIGPAANHNLNIQMAQFGFFLFEFQRKTHAHTLRFIIFQKILMVAHKR